MAAAEARAAWQRAANRCLVQEDAKRAPKLACCPPPLQPHDASDGSPPSPQDLHSPTFMPINWNLMNSSLPMETQWWLQLQPNFGCQAALARDHLNYVGGDAAEKKMEGLAAPVSKLEDVQAKNAADPFEPPWIVSMASMKQTPETGLEELKNLAFYTPVSLKCKGNANNCIYEDKESAEFKAFDPLFPKKPQKEHCEMHAPWEQTKKSQPWWQVADVDGLASLVAERAMENIINNDLPRPTQTVRVHGAEVKGRENKDDYGLPALSVGKEPDPVHDTMEYSYSVSSTTNDTYSSDGGRWQQHQRNNVPGDAQDSDGSTINTPGSKPTYQNASERAKLLDALRHSQTRAREAEIAAKKAYDEKDHVIKLLFRQASHLFACKQWLKMLQLENICLQLRFKEHQIATMFPDLPWMVVKEKVAPSQEHNDGTRKKGRRPNRKGGLCNAVAFAVGVGLVGAGLLLGWTLGWLLP
ncbi:hypothetical protein BDA96_02G191400 [Sorghum bicolor]|uniref:Uncharacterized protein n=2 Tax=Sorghum bicolor TaxID=4558 RepID=A0A1B6QC40_SORBI|nr:uncharacterized protein LOC8055578 [Sorghum bicolor]XP_021308970.1 uncharacterized protein LOC8055578 [Sorghum bicolor]KAG0543445.1 hypothetical protein BDA96_02G191400 [Sorghum bicolor]KXG35486.1 hypothetical protein SORBI_3002G181300 [Sorghum bicolor]OQU89373.1 hypothetical protein SORBI_3002G181300 [Sorghum bicolor]OQU89374.1 hypothetical protein SORBI_3002G181300 [Sorghum bicolor]|eukprot:XP_002460116.2 uncharacterized protein LOC8055578 [Sorghum bicolor]